MSILPNLRAEETTDEGRQVIQEQLEKVPPGPPAEEAAPPDDKSIKTDFTSGNGVVVAKSSNGELRIAGYMVMRYLNQLPASQSFTDHLGVSRKIDTANYFSAPHRILFSFTGWIYDP